MNSIEKEKYNWIVVGGGISGISVAEILCRGGESVLLIEKNEQLSSETSKVFHEWLHSGSLYSLAPDRLLTLRYLLGATDDLFEKLAAVIRCFLIHGHVTYFFIFGSGVSREPYKSLFPSLVPCPLFVRNQFWSM